MLCKILLADDSINMQKFIWHTFNHLKDYQLKFVNSPLKLESVLQKFQPDVLILHIDFFDDDAQSHIQDLIRRFLKICLIVESDSPSQDFANLHQNSQQIVVLRKPLTSELLLETVQKLASQKTESTAGSFAFEESHLPPPPSTPPSPPSPSSDFLSSDLDFAFTPPSTPPPPLSDDHSTTFTSLTPPTPPSFEFTPPNPPPPPSPALSQTPPSSSFSFTPDIPPPSFFDSLSDLSFSSSDFETPSGSSSHQSVNSQPVQPTFPQSFSPDTPQIDFVQTDHQTVGHDFLTPSAFLDRPSDSLSSDLSPPPQPDLFHSAPESSFDPQEDQSFRQNNLLGSMGASELSSSQVQPSVQSDILSPSFQDSSSPSAHPSQGWSRTTDIKTFEAFLEAHQPLFLELFQKICEKWLAQNFKDMAKTVIQEEISKLVEEESHDA